MREIKLDKLKINDETRPFVIAEVGHNHQGNMESAIKLIAEAANAGASAVKFQKRSNRNLFTPELYNQIYNSENAFGKTYGEHREALEFNLDQYKICIDEAKKQNITFFATAFDFESADFLNDLNMPLYKVASGDLQNLPLLKYIATFNKPMIISTGGSNLEMIRNAVDTIQIYHNQIVILQCTASYPAKYEQLNLRVISKLREIYPDNVIGYSGHDNGIAMAVAAFTLGARVIEKHFTLNRTLKGTDHAFSLEPQGLSKMVRDLDRASKALGNGHKTIYDEEKQPIIKMGKMIVAAQDLKVGHKLTVEDLDFRSPAIGLPPSYSTELVGKVIKTPIRKCSPILFEYLD